MVNNHNYAATSPVLQAPSKDVRAQRWKHAPEVRRTFFSRVYGGNKAALPSKESDHSEGEEEYGYDHNSIAVDENGLPLTWSDQAWAHDSEIDNALIQRQRQEQEEQERALDSLLKASRALSRLWFQQKQDRYSSSSDSTEGHQRSSNKCVGPGTLQELELLRLAIRDLSYADDQADPSPTARKLRQRYAEEKQEKSGFTMTSLKRKPLPGHDCPVDIMEPEDINPYLASPEPLDEPQEELITYSTSPLMMRSPKMRGFFTAIAPRKIELNDDSSEELSDEEDGSIARYYISKHRASRKNEFQGLSRPTGVAPKAIKAARRRTSILGSRDEVKSHFLIQSEGLDRYQQGVHADFLETLDDEHGQMIGTDSACALSCEDTSSSSDERRSSIDCGDAISSQGSHSPPSETTSFRSSPTLGDTDDEGSRDESWLGSLSSTSTSLTHSCGEDGSFKSGILDLNFMAERSPTALSPPRPKRHPLRPDTLIVTRSPKSDSSELYYSSNLSSSDLTPRPCNVSFKR